MRRFPFRALSVVAFLLVAVAPLMRAQKLSGLVQAGASAPPATVEENRKALNSVFAAYWQAQMEHDPEFASTLGDKRYNDRITDYSVKAENAWLERETESSDAVGGHRHDRAYRRRKDQPRPAAQRVYRWTRRLRSSRSGRCRSTRWTASTRPIRNWLAELSFSAVKDYDDWIARLHAIPKAFAQVTDEHVDRHGRPSRAAEVSAWKRRWSR